MIYRPRKARAVRGVHARVARDYLTRAIHKRAHARAGRGLVVYLICVEGRVPVKQAARVLGRDRRNIRRALQRVEERRDVDRAFDYSVDVLAGEIFA